MAEKIKHPVVGVKDVTELYKHHAWVAQPPEPYSYEISRIADRYYVKSGDTGEVELSSGDARTAIQYAIDNLPTIHGTAVKGGVIVLKVGHAYLDRSLDVDDQAVTLRGENWIATNLRPTGNFPVIRIRQKYATVIEDVGFGIDPELEATYTAYLIDTLDYADWVQIRRCHFLRASNCIRLMGSANVVTENLTENTGNFLTLKARGDASIAYNQVVDNVIAVKTDGIAIKLEPTGAYNAYANVISNNLMRAWPGATNTKGVLIEDGIRNIVQGNKFHYITSCVEESGAADYNYIFGNESYGHTALVALVGANSREYDNFPEVRKSVIYISFPSVAFSYTHTSYGADADRVCRRLTFDKSMYRPIKSVKLQAILAVSAGYIVYLRLFNVTDGIPVPGGELSTSATARTLLTSGDIKDGLPDGERTYEIQVYVTGGTGYFVIPIAWLIVELA